MENQAPKVNPQRSLLLEQAREAKTSPGIYLMKDLEGVVLYVGKAKSLKNRLLSYFQSPVHETPRIEMLVNRIERFDLILTETEAEALILEATLIKKYKPKFNIRLKDDKTYPYLKLQVEGRAPRLEWTRRVLRDGARYFGPFPSAWSARQVMQLLNETFRLRDCSDNTFKHRSRPCILYQMGKCSGPCVGLVGDKDYRESVQEVIEVLEGKSDKLVQSLKKGMEDAASREEFEVAALYRDQIKNLELITQTQGVFEAGNERDRDVVGIARREVESHGTLLRIRGGRLVAVQHYQLQNADPSMPVSQLLFDFLSQYYLSLRATEQKAEAEGESVPQLKDVFPKEVLLPEAPEDCELLEKTLGLGVRVAESAVDTQLLNVAKTNAEYALEQSQKRTAGHGIQALEEVQDKLHLSKLPSRIECYDISNIQGEDAVASRVVFVDGAPDKNLYRRYKIRTVEGSNDFAMMKEVLDRRFSRTEEELPDLVVVDGGKGQLSQAVAILDELSVQGVGVVGLAKARVQSDFKATEVKSSFERIFIPNRKNPVSLLPHTRAYKLLTHVRDEAHRFAVTYHRVLRSKRTLHGG
ncbi:MAG: excinuclease ABC subunit UvrC [Bdellovibrionia bacterium]